MKITLDKIGTIVEDYNTTDLYNGNKLNNQLKELTSLLFYLESIRSKAHNNYELVINTMVKDGNSVARATNEANVLHPEMYQLRRILTSGYRVIDAMRTNISFVKEEMKNAAN